MNCNAILSGTRKIIINQYYPLLGASFGNPCLFPWILMVDSEGLLGRVALGSAILSLCQAVGSQVSCSLPSITYHVSLAAWEDDAALFTQVPLAAEPTCPWGGLCGQTQSWSWGWRTGLVAGPLVLCGVQFFVYPQFKIILAISESKRDKQHQPSWGGKWLFSCHCTFSSSVITLQQAMSLYDILYYIHLS